MKKEIANSLFVFAIASSILFIGMEFFLRYKGFYSSHTERIGLHRYQSVYEQNRSAYPVYSRNVKKEFVQNEFTRTISTNSFGFNDYEWQKQKTDSCRVIALGDSFTEGVGSSNDSSYVQQLRKLLPNTQIFCAGLSGCDPVFSYKFLADSLMPLMLPDIVTVAINSTDIGDIRIRGGMERFNGSDTIRAKQGPRWEWLYAHSYFVRFFVHRIMQYDLYLTSPHAAEHDTQQAIETLKNIMTHFVDLGRRNNTRVIFIFHPVFYEIIAGENQCSKLIEYAQSQKYEYVDVYGFFSDHNIAKHNAHQYFWKNDSHCNNTGYSLFTAAIAEKWPVQ